MKLTSRIISPLIKRIFRILCKVDSSELEKVPMKGPFIIVMNHINFVEVPLMYTHLYPRNLASIVKRESWDNPVFRFLGNAWEAVPLDRNATDLGAMRTCLESLRNGRILFLAPEGTRSVNGKLQKGHAGVVQIALHSNAYIIPIAHYGGENFWHNFKSLRRTPFSVRVGKPFRLKAAQHGNKKADRMAMTDQIMNRMSLLLPPDYRGAYPDPENADYNHLDFPEGQ